MKLVWGSHIYGYVSVITLAEQPFLVSTSQVPVSKRRVKQDNTISNPHRQNHICTISTTNKVPGSNSNYICATTKSDKAPIQFAFAPHRKPINLQSHIVGIIFVGSDSAFGRPRFMVLAKAVRRWWPLVSTWSWTSFIFFCPTASEGTTWALWAVALVAKAHWGNALRLEMIKKWEDIASTAPMGSEGSFNTSK